MRDIAQASMSPVMKCFGYNLYRVCLGKIRVPKPAESAYSRSWRFALSSSGRAPAQHGRTTAIGGSIFAIPLDLTDLELETAARACRALAYQEDQAAKRMENPGMHGPVENTAKRAAALAEKLERARAAARR
jgi:hypothetical protein